MSDDDENDTVLEQSVPVRVVYFNGFNLNASLSDIGMLLMFDGQPVTRLAMSFTTAKTVYQEIGRAIEDLEKITDNKIMTMEDVKTAYDKAEKK